MDEFLKSQKFNVYVLTRENSSATFPCVLFIFDFTLDDLDFLAVLAFIS